MFKLLNLKYTLIGVLVLWFMFLLASVFTIARANEEFTYCIDTSVSWLRFQVSIDPVDGYQYGFSGEGGEQDGAVFSVDAYDDGTAEVYLGVHWYTLTAEGANGNCDAETPLWRPGATEVRLPLTSDCSLVEIQDEYGNWSQVTEEDGTPVLLHYGTSLFVPAWKVTDPGRYRVTPTDCY